MNPNPLSTTPLPKSQQGERKCSTGPIYDPKRSPRLSSPPVAREAKPDITGVGSHHGGITSRPRRGGGGCSPEGAGGGSSPGATSMAAVGGEARRAALWFPEVGWRGVNWEKRQVALFAPPRWVPRCIKKVKLDGASHSVRYCILTSLSG